MSLTLAPRIRPATDAPADPVRAWLARLAGADLPAFAPAALPAAERTPAEADAASRAAACPDMFVVHAPDHLAGERVIADVARACPAGRALVLSPNPAAADRIVERLARAAAAVVRALADDENPVRPSPVVSRLTSAARSEQDKRAAGARQAALGRLAQLDAEAAELTGLRDAVEGAVRAEAAGKEATAFSAALDRLKAARAEAVRGVAARRDEADAALRQKEAALAELRKQHAASEKKPGFFARLLGKAQHGPDRAELEQQIRAAEQELAELTARSDAARAEAEAVSAADAAEFEKAIQEEVAARRVAFDTRTAEIAAERARLAPESGARQSELQVVVGTPGSLDADPVFRRESAESHAESAPPFVLLVLDRAEELTEHDFSRLARLAGRWVLVGDLPPADEPRPHLNGAHRPAPGRNGRAFGPADVPFAARLARHLDRETWAVEADRLVCRLAPLPAEVRRGLNREPLHDRADIELRFAQTADEEPVLAEVAFPVATPLATAKSFLFEQLDKILLRPCGQVEWERTPNMVTARWPAADQGAGSGPTWIDLEPGVREKVVGAGVCAFTAAVSFDSAAGWDAEKAAAWLDRHLPADSTCRFAAVPRTGHPARV